MRRVSLTSARPGQVVARAVTNAAGATLCPAGFALTEAAIARLRAVGVDAVVIEGAPLKRTDPAKRLLELRERFAGNSDGAMLGLKVMMERQLTRLIQEGET